MNRKELIEVMAEEAGITKAQAEKALATFLDSVVQTVTKGEKVALVGFGTFERRERSARTGVNPATGAKLEIPASHVPAFKAGKSFKDTVNNK